MTLTPDPRAQALCHRWELRGQDFRSPGCATHSPVLASGEAEASVSPGLVGLLEDYEAVGRKLKDLKVLCKFRDKRGRTGKKKPN